MSGHWFSGAVDRARTQTPHHAYLTPGHREWSLKRLIIKRTILVRVHTFLAIFSWSLHVHAAVQFIGD